MSTSRIARQRLETYAKRATKSHVIAIGKRILQMRRGKVRRIWDDVRALWALVRDPKAAWTSKAVAIGALLYVVTPMDAIPDIIPLMGLSDDVGVVLAAIAALGVQLVRYKAQAASNRRGCEPTCDGADPGRSDA